MQRQSPLRRWQGALWHEGHQVVHDCEDALLHLAGILRAQDDHLPPLEGHCNGGRRAHAFGLPIAWEDPRIEDNERLIRARPLEEWQLRFGRRHKHVLHEQRVVGTGGNHPDRHTVVLVPTTKTVHDVELLLQVQVVHRTLAVRQEGLVLQLHVDLAPPDVICGGLLEDDALVKRRPASLLAALHRDGARGDNGTPRLVLQCLLVEDARRRVVVDLLHVQAQLVDLLHDVKAVQTSRADLHGQSGLHLVGGPALQLGGLQLLHQHCLDLVLPGDCRRVVPLPMPCSSCFRCQAGSPSSADATRGMGR
mmetsp:Transcript_61827/g.191540  ORF Transcript_61827/g.191540 Transcript_61827/m.191540 type:complete len:307 (-) Transcript_61827:92-1012(-)